MSMDVKYMSCILYKVFGDPSEIKISFLRDIQQSRFNLSNTLSHSNDSTFLMVYSEPPLADAVNNLVDLSSYHFKKIEMLKKKSFNLR